MIAWIPAIGGCAMPKNVKIYISEDKNMDPSIYELYMAQKDCRGDILIEYEQKFYIIEFTTVVSLAQEYDWDKSIDRVSLIWVPTIIVDDCKKETIIKNILKLDSHYFKYFKPVKLDGDLFAPEWQDLNNWKRVYPE